MPETPDISGHAAARPARVHDRGYTGRVWRCGLAAVTIAGAVVAAGCGSRPAAASPAGPEKRDLVVAAVPGEGAAGLYIAQGQGLFARAGLQVTIKSVTSSSVVIPFLLHGSVDVASGQYTSYIAADAAGAAKMRILAPGYALGPGVQEVMTSAHSAIGSPAQLKGATIAVNALNSETTDLLYTALRQQGITPAQVHLVAIPFPAMPAALAAGDVDAIYEIEPYVTEAAEQDGDQQVTDIDTGASQDFPVAGYGTLASWAAKYPRTAAAFTRAIEKANEIATTDLAVRQHTLATALHLSPRVADLMAGGSFPAVLDPVQLQRVADLMRHYGQLARTFSVKSITGP